MSDKLQSFRAVIELWPTRAELAKDIGVKEGTAKLMHFRDSIHSIYWPKLVSAAKRRRFKGITLELLHALQGEKKAA